MVSTDKQARKLMKLHMDSSAHYRACAHITTEDDLIELFDSLSERRLKMSQHLVALSPVTGEKELWLLKDALCYLQRTWYHIKLALIVNNRQQILYHCLRNEQDMWQEYERMANQGDLPEELVKQGTQHQQLLKENMRLISETPTEKYSRQKNLEYTLRRAA